MAVPYWTLESESSTPLALTDPYNVREQHLPMPQVQAQYVSSSDSDGDALYASRYQNRVINLGLWVFGTSASDLESKVSALQVIVAKQNRSAVGTGVGGTLSYTSPTGDAVTFDVCTASIDGNFDIVYAVQNYVSLTLEFGCLPFWRGVEVEL